MPIPEKPDRIRAFAAVCLSQELLDEVGRQQERLARKLGRADARWVRIEQVHVTLRFYGSIPGSDLEQLKSALGRSVQGIAPFQLSVAKICCFPSKQRPSVIWLGLEGDLGSLRKLQEQVEQATGAFGSHAEKREFHPHLTIGRVKARGSEARRAGELIQAASVGRLGEWSVREMTLMQSRLHPHGSVYTPLAQVALPGE